MQWINRFCNSFLHFTRVLSTSCESESESISFMCFSLGLHIDLLGPPASTAIFIFDSVELAALRCKVSYNYSTFIKQQV